MDEPKSTTVNDSWKKQPEQVNISARSPTNRAK